MFDSKHLLKLQRRFVYVSVIFTLAELGSVVYQVSSFALLRHVIT